MVKNEIKFVKLYRRRQTGLKYLLQVICILFLPVSISPIIALTYFSVFSARRLIICCVMNESRENQYSISISRTVYLVHRVYSVKSAGSGIRNNTNFFSILNLYHIYHITNYIHKIPVLYFQCLSLFHIPLTGILEYQFQL